METIKSIIEKSGDSIFEKYEYSNGILSIFLVLGDTEEHITIQIKTDAVTLNSNYLQQKNNIFRTCRVELKELIHSLSSENGIYVPSNSFSILMEETKKNLNLAYGKRLSEIKYMLSLVGYENLICCTLKELNESVHINSV